ncbi:MAG: F0F1 ATP synthase subunit B [Alphaproteobacteria bacterium]|nr:F0F1 ATP synthase subunit B [Alphaproteobacteria bacterium]
MAIDWITVVAQIVNFAILVWLLKRFLYGPILRAIDAREAEIQARMTEAAQARADAARQEAEYRAKSDALDHERAAALEAIQDEAADLRREMDTKVRAEADAERAAWSGQLQAERRAFLSELRGRAVQGVARLTRKALADMADEALEDRLAAKFESELRAFASDLATAASDSAGETAVVATAFDLPQKRREEIEKTLQHILGEGVPVRFDTSQDNAFGLVLTFAGVQVAWTIDAYLDELESDIEGRLKAPTNRTERAA